MKRRCWTPLRIACCGALWIGMVSSPAQERNSASLPAQLSPYRITGIVVDSVTKSPIQNATLTAAPMNTVKRRSGTRRRGQNQADAAACESGADGRFELLVPAAGGWELTATARGYRTQSLDEHDGYSTAVVLTEAAPRFSVTFRLTPSSVIEGFVLDEAGEAVRDANVALVYLPPPGPDSHGPDNHGPDNHGPDNLHRRPVTRAQQMTDDRGYYKFGMLGAGTYEVRVSAHPWYATEAGGAPSLFSNGGLSEPDTQSAGPDPLDVVYATVWYPGATDPSAATPITLRGGETQQADFRLLPIAGSHLRVAGPAETGDRESRPPVPNMYLTRLLSDGTEEGQQTPTRIDGHGNADIAGLSPGTYLVHQQSPSGAATLSTIQVGAGSSRTMNLSEGIPAATVTVQVDPAGDLDSLQVSFREVETGHTTYAQRFQDGGRQIRRRGQSQNEASGQLGLSGHDAHAPRPDRTVSLPPGKYEVFLNGTGDVHLSGIEATGATAVGRLVTIGSGAPRLLLHTATGLGTVTGVVDVHGKPLAGALVMLIPATLDSPSGLDLPSRDQSNTDGSFEMSGLLPGGYILIAIDQGWEVNWSDPSTLRRYLLHGTPLEIKPGADLKLTVAAQSP